MPRRTLPFSTLESRQSIMNKKEKQAEIYEKLAGIGYALSSPHRLKVLSLLAHGEKTIDELARLTGQSLASASAHVKQLRANHLVTADKRGRNVYCRLSDDQVGQLWLDLRDLGEVLVPDIREIMRDQFDADEELSPLTEQELDIQMRQGDILLLDLRPATEYAAGHLPTARNVPYDELSTAMPKLPKRSPLLVYCRGPFCVNAYEGNRQLRENRYRAQRLRFSVPEWKAAGLPVEAGE